MTLVTTPGAANANSYASIAEADAYHQGHLYASGWVSATDPTKEAALIMAARLLDAMPGAWSGACSSSTQFLGWPRTGMVSRNGYALASGVIPIDLKYAQAEYARQLIASDLTATNDIQAQGIQKIKAGPVELTYKEPLSQKDIANPSNRALATMVPDAVKFLIPASWLKTVAEQENQEKQAFVFRAV